MKTGAPMLAKLVLLREANRVFGGLRPREPLSQRIFHLEGQKTKIGRDAAVADIVLPSSAVSRVHASICRAGEEYLLENSSRNGTVLNGLWLGPGEIAPLCDRDQIEV